MPRLVAALALLLLARAASAGDDDKCTSCLWVVRIANDALCDYGLIGQAIEQVENNMCSQFSDPDERDVCDQLTEALLPIAVDYLRSELIPSQVCAAAGLCKAAAGAEAVAAAAARAHPAAGSAECALCSYAVKQLGSAPGGQAPLEDAVRALPSELTGAWAQFVTHRGSALSALAKQEAKGTLPPGAACELTGACPLALVQRLQALPRELMHAALRHASGSSSLVALRLSHEARGPLALSDPTCDKCKMFVIEMHMLMANTATQQSLANYTRDHVCPMVAPYSDQCRDYMDLYGVAVLAAIARQLEKPDQVCAYAHLCASSAASVAGGCGSSRSAAAHRGAGAKQQDAGLGLAGMVGRVWEGAEWALGMLRVSREAGQQPDPALAAE